ncbi:hypothetical protein E2542_SST28141 [Spatholobus suberectus]|nr:hypothetical protein E2542_SST28141 [Spatholobus suberectus]
MQKLLACFGLSQRGSCGLAGYLWCGWVLRFCLPQVVLSWKLRSLQPCSRRDIAWTKVTEQREKKKKMVKVSEGKKLLEKSFFIE